MTSIMIAPLQQLCAPFGWEAVAALLWAAGFVLFMMPPTTGLPVYILAGTLLPAKFGEDPAAGDGLQAAFFRASFVSIMAKICVEAEKTINYR